MSSDTPNISPGELVARLSVSERTVRRMAEAYETVFDPLPRDRRGHRLFPALAAERMEQAAQITREVPGSSTVEVFTALRDGRRLSRRIAPAPDTLAPVMEELRLIREELANLRAMTQAVATGFAAVADRERAALAARVRPATPTPDPDPTSDPKASTPAPSRPARRKAAATAPAPSQAYRPTGAQAALLERLRAGHRLVGTGRDIHELSASGDPLGLVSWGTAQTLETHGLLVRDGDQLQLAEVRLLME